MQVSCSIPDFAKPLIQALVAAYAAAYAAGRAIVDESAARAAVAEVTAE